MRILITGASGFVGRALCKHLEKKHTLLATLRNEKQTCLLSDRVTTFIIPSDKNTDWTPYLKSIDTVIHLAAHVHHKGKLSHSYEKYEQVNVSLTSQLASQAIENNVKHFIFLSTIGVHGNKTKNAPFSESSPICPHNFYTKSKWQAELRLKSLCENKEMNLTILRLPLIYGGRAPGNFKSLLNVIKKGVPLPLASVNNQRSFLYIENLVDLIENIILQKTNSSTYLVSDGKDLSTAEFIKLIQDATQSPRRLLPFPVAILKSAGRVLGRSHQIEQLTEDLQVNSQKIERQLSWKPRFTPETAFLDLQRKGTL